MRAIVSGAVRCGTMDVAVKVYAATKTLTPRFTRVHKTTGKRATRDVAWEDLGKGYEVSRGEYAPFTKEELAALDAREGADAIEICEFVDLRDVDLSYIERSYWVAPGGKTSTSFAILRLALMQAGKVALVKARLRTRTRLALLRPRGGSFLSLDLMRFSDEHVRPDELVMPPGKPPTRRELELAQDLVARLSGPFDASRYPDEYRAAVQAAVDAKVERDQIVGGEARDAEKEAAGVSVLRGPETSNVIDLADLLAKTVKGVRRPC
jgi:DNA end-binding protein Ku